jgi:hypothetical protein
MILHLARFDTILPSRLKGIRKIGIDLHQLASEKPARLMGIGYKSLQNKIKML